jgi:hypothetical protein
MSFVTDRVSVTSVVGNCTSHCVFQQHCVFFICEIKTVIALANNEGRAGCLTAGPGRLQSGGP